MTEKKLYPNKKDNDMQCRARELLHLSNSFFTLSLLLLLFSGITLIFSHYLSLVLAIGFFIFICLAFLLEWKSLKLYKKYETYY